jgi:4-hydroxy-3-polyprenylbenzoate decarboxylase
MTVGSERIFVGITGASGHAYATRLVRALVDAGLAVDVSLSPAGALVMRHELGIDAGADGRGLTDCLETWLGTRAAEHVRAWPHDAIDAPAASGSALGMGAVLCPCSMGTLSRVSIGFSSNLIERAADVALKEGRRLIVVPRESPLSEVHLENMLRLARMGAVVLPAAPGFYHGPANIDELVDHVVGKILDRLGLRHSIGARWEGIGEPPVEGPEAQTFAPPADLRPGDAPARAGDA